LGHGNVGGWEVCLKILRCTRPFESATIGIRTIDKTTTHHDLESHAMMTRVRPMLIRMIAIACRTLSDLVVFSFDWDPVPS